VTRRDDESLTLAGDHESAAITDPNYSILQHYDLAHIDLPHSRGIYGLVIAQHRNGGSYCIIFARATAQIDDECKRIGLAHVPKAACSARQ
jgi:hypothetical protein